jgi:hypothetical protein
MKTKANQNSKKVTTKKVSAANEFMLAFRLQPNLSYQPTEVELNEMHQQWGAFIGKIALQEKLVSTHQLGFEGVQVLSNKKTKDGIYISKKETLGGNMIIKANSLTEATEMAKACPILAMGGTVEVRNILAM